MATQEEKLKQLAEETKRKQQEIEKTVYMDDFLKSFKEVIAYVERAKQELTTLSGQHKAELQAKLASALSSMETMKKSVETQISNSITELKSDQRTFQRMFNEQLNRLSEEMPDEYDDEELATRLNELQTAFNELKIPDQFDATELESQVDKNTKDIEELRKQPRGGGVTNARIEQAFKYILKTEQPSGDIDGVNTDYTVTQPIFAVLQMSINGEIIAELPNYTISGKTISFSTAIPAVYSGKDFEIKYI